jgi:hypothetical protein
MILKEILGNSWRCSNIKEIIPSLLETHLGV